MRPKYLVTILALLALAVSASPAHAGGVVSVCDEAHLLAALAGGGTVTFACSGTITLTATITTATDTTIDGSGQAVTISGNHAVRVFTVNSGMTLNLNGLTVANGSAAGEGGGILNYGTLNVSNSIFSGNSANYGGGINNNGGTLTVSNSTFSNNSAVYVGGGINNNHTLTVSNSTFSNNSAGSAGGIYNDHTLTVSNSTFSGNSAGGGGGILNYANSGTLTVSNSTFSNNSASHSGGGILNFANYGTVTVSNSTFSANSATNPDGVILNENAGTVTLKNTIVANSPTGGNCAGTLTDGGGNLSYPDTSCPGINSDPVLGPLQNNGGPTQTMALGPASAALDAANDAICAAAPVNNRDQRGIARPQGPHCDIGAYEATLQPMTRRAFLPIIFR